MSIDPGARGLAANANSGLLAHQSRILPAVPSIAFLGDSRLWQCHNTTATASELRNIGIAYHLLQQTGGRVRFPETLNFAVGSSTSADQLNSTYSVMSAAGKSLGNGQLANYPNMTPVQAVIANKASIAAVIVLCSTNDRTNSFTATWNTAQASSDTDTLSCLYRICQQLTAAGLPVILVDELPRGDTTFTSKRITAPDLDYHLRTSNWVRNLVMPGVYPAKGGFRALALASSSTGDATVGQLYDGLHPSYSGAYYLAQKIAPIIDLMFPACDRLFGSNTDLYSANNPTGNLIANGMMQGSSAIDVSIGGGTSAGNKPSSWTVGGSNTTGLTVTGTVGAATTAGDPAYQLAISGTGGASTPKVEFRQNATLANVSTGDVLRTLSWIECDASLSNVSAWYVSSYILDGGSALLADYRAGGPASSSVPLTIAHGGFLETPDLVVPAGAATVRTRIQIEFKTSVAVALTIRYGPTAMRKVVPY